MSDFKDRMFEYDIDSAESALQWSKPGGFFGEKLFRSIFNAARYYSQEANSLRIDKETQYSLLNDIKLSLEEKSISGKDLLEQVDSLNDDLNTKDKRIEELTVQNERLEKENELLRGALSEVISNGVNLSLALNNVTVDGEAGPWQEELSTFETALNEAEEV